MATSKAKRDSSVKIPTYKISSKIPNSRAFSFCSNHSKYSISDYPSYKMRICCVIHGSDHIYSNIGTVYALTRFIHESFVSLLVFFVCVFVVLLLLTLFVFKFLVYLNHINP